MADEGPDLCGDPARYDRGECGYPACGCDAVDPLFFDRSHPGVDTNIRFQEHTKAFGVVRLQYHPEGIALWVGGECRWRSWRDPALWDVRPKGSAS